MTSSELWNRATADRYDTEEAETSSPAVLEPTLAFLAELAGNDRALEFAQFLADNYGITDWTSAGPAGRCAGPEPRPVRPGPRSRECGMNTSPSVSAIGDIVITARPFTDYTAQFALTTDDLLAGPVLDCAGGASDFAATVRSLGGTAVSTDPAYRQSPSHLTHRVERDLNRVRQWTATQPDRFPLDESGQWTHAQRWNTAAGHFLEDFRRDRNENTGHYRAASLPSLPFPDDSFTLAVSGFLLFTYPGHFDLAFHLAAIRELTRVSADVRLHPLNDSAQTPFRALPRLLHHLAEDGTRTELFTVQGQSDSRDTATLRLTRR
ncbi:hypothetical protein ACIP88_17025 [Streptomyces uncialis]|uniref:hypothetical protein n=1 Tax=Streptomyces uncialis TaxID=1048205 RepID=UPI0037FD0643